MSQHKTSCWIKKLREKFPKLVWPLKIPRLIILPLSISLENQRNKNKVKNLANFITFLKSNQFHFDKKLRTKKTSELKNQKDETLSYFNKPILKADLKNIYNKLKKSEIIQKKNMKIETKKSLLLYEDYKIIRLFSDIATSILNYFSCCDNFSRVKSIVYYFVRLSLATTLMQKHKMSSTYQVFKEHGENLRVNHPNKRNRTVNFLTKNEIHK
jgi:hypothetical protein